MIRDECSPFISPVRQRLPMFMREVATDTEVTKKMKRAANSIDKFRYVRLS